MSHRFIDPLRITCEIPGASEGPLHDVTLAVKDIIDIAGVATGAGSPAVLEAAALAAGTRSRSSGCSTRAPRSSARPTPTRSPSASSAPTTTTARPATRRPPDESAAFAARQLFEAWQANGGWLSAHEPPLGEGGALVLPSAATVAPEPGPGDDVRLLSAAAVCAPRSTGSSRPTVPRTTRGTHGDT